MKPHLLQSLAVLLVITFVFSGCDLVDSVDDITFDTTLDPITFQVAESQTSQNKSYASAPIRIEITDNPDVAIYVDKLKEVKIKKIEYAIENYSATPGTSVTFSNGSMVYSATSGGTTSELASVGNVNLASANNGPSVELPVSQSSFDALGALLLDKKEAYISTKGTLSSTPVSFNVVVTITLAVTADALD